MAPDAPLCHAEAGTGSTEQGEDGRQLHGWRFRLEPAPGGLWVIMSVAGGKPATWFVPARPAPAA